MYEAASTRTPNAVFKILIRVDFFYYTSIGNYPASLLADNLQSFVSIHNPHITTATWSVMYLEMSPRKQDAKIDMTPNAMLT